MAGLSALCRLPPYCVQVHMWHLPSSPRAPQATGQPGCTAHLARWCPGKGNMRVPWDMQAGAPEEDPGGDELLLGRARGLLHDVHVGRVEPQRRGRGAVRDQVDPQQLRAGSAASTPRTQPKAQPCVHACARARGRAELACLCPGDALAGEARSMPGSVSLVPAGMHMLHGACSTAAVQGQGRAARPAAAVGRTGCTGPQSTGAVQAAAGQRCSCAGTRADLSRCRMTWVSCGKAHRRPEP